VKFNILNRKIHNWATPIIAVPLLLIIVTGILLQLKKQVSWVQPTELRGSQATPAISLPEILDAAKSVPEAEIRSWDDISRIDMRPNRGLLKVLAKNHWEIQIDTGDGRVLQSAYRRSDVIESLHDGSFFHDGVKLWVFLPIALILLAMWLTGLYMFVLPYIVKSRRRT
jgi:hypothetical protein